MVKTPLFIINQVSLDVWDSLSLPVLHLFMLTVKFGIRRGIICLHVEALDLGQLNTMLVMPNLLSEMSF